MPRDEIVRELHPLQRLAQHELGRVQDERLVVRRRDQLGQIGLRSANVDVRVPIVPEDPEVGVEVKVDRRWLETARVVRVDTDSAGLHGGADIAVRQDGHRARLSQARGRWGEQARRDRSDTSTDPKRMLEAAFRRCFGS